MHCHTVKLLFVEALGAVVKKSLGITQMTVQCIIDYAVSCRNISFTAADKNHPSRRDVTSEFISDPPTCLLMPGCKLRTAQTQTKDFSGNLDEFRRKEGERRLKRSEGRTF